MKANTFFLLLGLIALLCSCDDEIIPDVVGTKAWNDTDTLPGQGLSITIVLDTTWTEYNETVYFPL